MADTNLSAVIRPSIGGYSLYGVTSGLSTAAPSAITSPPLAGIQAIYAQIGGAQGYWSLDPAQVSTANGNRETVPASTIVEVWRNSAQATATGTLVFYLLAQVGTPESTIRIEWM